MTARRSYRSPLGPLALEAGDDGLLGLVFGDGGPSRAGSSPRARAHLDAAEKTLAPGFHLPHVHAVQAAANIELYTGDAASAVRRLDAAWPEIERIGALRLQLLRVELQLLRARALLADDSQPREERARAARAIADDVIKEGAPWAVGLALTARASALALRDDRDGAAGALLAAEEQLAASGMDGWLHVARLRRGMLDGGPGGTARAEAARDALRDLGAADPDAVAALLVPWR